MCIRDSRFPGHAEKDQLVGRGIDFGGEAQVVGFKEIAGVFPAVGGVLLKTFYADDRAVSYTHLDVYKRQVQLTEVLLLSDFFQFISKCHLRTNPFDTIYKLYIMGY